MEPKKQKKSFTTYLSAVGAACHSDWFVASVEPLAVNNQGGFVVRFDILKFMADSCQF